MMPDEPTAGDCWYNTTPFVKKWGKLWPCLFVAVFLMYSVGCGQQATNNARKGAQDSPKEDKTAQKPAPKSGQELYVQHCAACHGEKGNGQGLAARFLFPKPRDFTRGQFRLVSTKNYAPSRGDLRAVLMRGMPGSAMPPWAHLESEAIERLIDEVLRLYRDGVRASIVAELKEADEEVVEADVAEQVRERTTPDQTVAVLPIGDGDSAAVARGREVYIAQSCHSCHGKDGRGDGQQTMVDNDGIPTRPRDFTAGIFKGGFDAASIYRRISLGMPGTPMPSSANLTPEQITDLAHFIRSLSSEEKRYAAILKRERLLAKHVSEIAESVNADIWSQSPATHIKTTPLWWRDNAEGDLRVQAAHDGKRIAFRLSWSDQTSDRQSAQTEAFKDVAAIELYRGPAEPFIGMGAAGQAVDLWVWDADRENALAAADQRYPNAVVDVYPLTEAAVETAEFTRSDARLEQQANLALPAKAVGNQVSPAARASAGSSLAAAGPGSVTFRLPENQAVVARGEWRDGRWTVVLSRELKAAETAGLTLLPGDKVSAAFAIWDGSHRDRNGQKLISIWQDLELESESKKP